MITSTEQRLALMIALLAAMLALVWLALAEQSAEIERLSRLTAPRLIFTALEIEPAPEAEAAGAVIDGEVISRDG